MDNGITYFGKTNFRGQEHVFGIKQDDRRRHTYIIGKTGMGKTTLLENMIISDIMAGNGLAVVDPHGDLAEKILDFVPSSRINDVIYFNPADIEYPIAFNVMEHVDPKYRHLVASGLIGVFKKIWADSWGPRLEYLLRNTILGLLEYPDSTLMGVPRMLIDEDFRKKVVSKISDPVVKTFWNDEFTKYSKQFMVEAISPIQNKVGQFLSSSLVRNIVSQPQSSIDMRDIMDNRKIFIVNLAKGRIGEDYSALLGAMIITKIQLAAMGRVDTPEEERKDFYLYVDEFQNFATESFAGILSEARKYRLDLIVAHQYIGQLEETVRDAIFGNIGTLISFRVGATDAEFLEKEFEPIFMMNDLVNLAKYDMYLKLMIDGVSGDAFSATSLPPVVASEKSSAEKIIKVSRERYTKKKEVVEDKVARWSGYVKDEEHEGEIRKENFSTSKAIQENREKKDNRELWDAVCAICGSGIKVPFRPDPSRDTYCKDCLVQVRKQMAETIKSPAERKLEAAPTPVVTENVDIDRKENIINEPSIIAKEVEKVMTVTEKAIPEIPEIKIEKRTDSGQLLKREVVQEKSQMNIVRKEIRETVVATPKPEIKKPAYDPEKMLKFYEMKRQKEKERERKEKGLDAENVKDMKQSIDIKSKPISVPAKHIKPEYSEKKPVEQKSSLDSSKTDTKEIREGEVIKFGD
ncbi:MAG: type IV secretion system DNA-binding domain-containing protein [Candidatus Pacebacteria bacterium]|nr:type IV secretion system DNA-binding domain-containing protein [Candidatus Paceibacterota bacterium]